MFRPSTRLSHALPGWSRWDRVHVLTLRDHPLPPFPVVILCADGFGQLLVPHRWVAALEAVWCVLPEWASRTDALRVATRLRRGPEALVHLAKYSALVDHVRALTPPDDWRTRRSVD